jgi:hypothetical protein
MVEGAGKNGRDYVGCVIFPAKQQLALCPSKNLLDNVLGRTQARSNKKRQPTKSNACQMLGHIPHL